MNDQPCRQVWRKQEGYNTDIFLFAVNWNCTSVTIIWPENNYWATFIPSDDGWVMVLERGQIDPFRACKAENAGQISSSVYVGMAKWAQQIFRRCMLAGYNAIEADAQNPQLSLF